ncbi:MAG: DUF2088 domain-containing protein [Clostridiales bacterium]|jgi:nickel-dependent lactate racemase|nr:DUF2088 domain-containing protein [Clostridiales bacterium]
MWFYKENVNIEHNEQYEMMANLVEKAREKYGKLKRVLLLPPDITRYHSGAGNLTNMLYHILGKDCEIKVIPTLGQHVPHTPEENKWMFGDIPEEKILKHNWKTDCNTLGEIPADFVKTATGGLADWPIPVEINREVTSGYDLVINIGQVVPHEVLGFANHNKNYFIGLGGKNMICASHITAALCGIENNLGQVITPLRGCYNYAEKEYLGGVPSIYALIVKTRDEQNNLKTTGLYVGEDMETYVKAARYAREKTVFMFEKPLKKVVCFMDGREFKSTWVGNKAVYRTRKVIEDGGELIIIAPGVERFGEQPEVDRMIRKYGYKGTPHSLEAFNSDPELHDLAHAAAHLIHGSSEGRFNITYAPGHLTKEEVESVGFGYMDINEAVKKYNPDTLKSGLNIIDGEEVYFIDSPSLGLWTSKDKFKDALENNMAFGNRMIALRPHEEIWKQIKQWNEEDMSSF